MPSVQREMGCTRPLAGSMILTSPSRTRYCTSRWRHRHPRQGQAGDMDAIMSVRYTLSSAPLACDTQQSSVSPGTL